jgi:3-oxoacyl-[acyl-carrier protein] reductase
MPRSKSFNPSKPAVDGRWPFKKPQDVRALFDATVERFGRVHILVNTAGIILSQRLEQTTDDEFDRLFAVNVKGVFNALREASRRLEDGGRIINFSSSTTRLMLPTYASYCATKAPSSN